ncbi:MAG: hypothetical protein H0T73_22360 [Ardenticatenales bacterium]|nr:hypothetical protein [Ardenticatenales bacterium]
MIDENHFSGPTRALAGWLRAHPVARGRAAPQCHGDSAAKWHCHAHDQAQRYGNGFPATDSDAQTNHDADLCTTSHTHQHAGAAATGAHLGA